MEKGEIALYEQFLLFPQRFQKTSTADTLKISACLQKGKELMSYHGGQGRTNMFTGFPTPVMTQFSFRGTFLTSTRGERRKERRKENCCNQILNPKPAGYESVRLQFELDGRII